VKMQKAQSELAPAELLMGLTWGGLFPAGSMSRPN
jgi:hypothetical protein